MDGWLERMRTINISRRGFIRVAAKYLAAGGAAATTGPFIIGCRSAAPTTPSGGQKELVIIYGVPRATMDPQNHINTYDESPLGNIFETLVEMDRTIRPDGWKPKLAVSWRRIDERTVEFKLREGVRFHNGEPFDAEAVKFTIDRFKGRVDPNLKPPHLTYYGILDRAEPVDRYTVRVITSKPDPIIINRMSGFATRIVSPKFYSEHNLAFLQENANGTGPYRLVKWVRDGDMILEANEDYWGGPPEFKRVVIKTVPEASTRVSALLAGDADIVVAVPMDEMDAINRSGRARTENVTSNRMALWYLHPTKPPTNNKLVRQALNYAANIDGLLRTVYRGMGRRVATIVAPWAFGYDPDLKPYPYDPDRARELLRQSRVELPINLTIHHIQGRYTKDKEMAEGIAAELNKLGPQFIRVTTKIYESGYYYSIFNDRAKRFEVFDGIMFASWGNWMFDADLYFFPWVHTASTFTCCPDRKDWDALIEEAQATVDERKRLELYKRLQRELFEEAPFIFAHNVEDIYGVSNRVEWKPRQDEMVWAAEMRVRRS